MKRTFFPTVLAAAVLTLGALAVFQAIPCDDGVTLN